MSRECCCPFAAALLSSSSAQRATGSSPRRTRRKLRRPHASAGLSFRVLLEEPPRQPERRDEAVQLVRPRALDGGREPRALVDRALGVELRGEVRAADREGRDAEGEKWRLERRVRDLPRANHDGVDVEHAPLSSLADLDVQAVVVHLLVLHAAHHLHAPPLECCTMDPPRRPPQPGPELPLLALQQVDLPPPLTQSASIIAAAATAAADLRIV
mmetsp:Transcript_23942/g.76876  ORF Transcript_23942/g.76876 Transcript_23942/m.76876 type:complete len:214 (+) Transcript_23942:415-1056(+)